jgi:hypothetical protein
LRNEANKSFDFNVFWIYNCARLRRLVSSSESGEVGEAVRSLLGRSGPSCAQRTFYPSRESID